MRYLNNIFTTALLLLIGFCFTWLGTEPAYAQSVGSHLGEGDIGTQISNIEILQANGAGNGFPVTAMININTAGQNQQAMHQLSAAISNAGFFPIVRITHVCDSFDSGVTPNGAVENIRESFGGNAIIVYGNEVNNREAECDNWGRYVSDFNSIEDKTNVAPAALDFYMGNPEYTVDQFFSTPGAEEIYQNAGGTYVANAYGCVGRTEGDCNSPFEPNTQQIGYQSYPGQVYLTEFSLSPEGRRSDAPDTNLTKVVEFIEEKAGETGISVITPLVRNVCNNEGEWLLYVNGQLFTIAGTNVTDNCEGAADVGEGYDLSDFPDYGYNQSYYYLHPIKGIHPDSQPGGRQVSVARSDLANQGYEAYCAAETTRISLDVDTQHLIDLFLDANPSGIRNEPVESTYTLDSNRGLFPIFRDTNDVKYFTSSLEEYVGFKDVYTDDGYSVKELNTAPINSLLSQEQRCIESVRILRDTQLMCERLNDPANCALLSNPIPGTDYNVNQLLDDVADVIPGYRAGRIIDECKALFTNSDPELEEVKEGILNTPLYLDNSYRLAFLVASIEQRPASNAFNFFSFSDVAEPRDEVLMVAFKIPDILTNKGGGETAGHQYFTDAATETRNVLVPEFFRTSESDDNPGFNRESRDRRARIEQQAEAASLQTEDSAIYCLDTAGGGPDDLANAEGSPACKDILGKAVVDIINGSPPSCDNLRSEPVREILQAANFIPPQANDPSRVFNPGYGFGTEVLNFIFLNNTDGPQRTESTFTTLLNIFDNRFDGAEDEHTEVDFYLVYPVGYELESVTEVIKNSFFSQQQIAELEEGNNRDRFDARGISSSLAGGTYSRDFEALISSGECEESTDFARDPETGEIIVPPQEITTYDCSKTFDISVREEGSGGLSVLGADLGYWMRSVQLALNSYFSSASLYVESCSTMEEFLLGNCSGGAAYGSGIPGASGRGSGSTTPNATCEVDTAREGVWEGHGLSAFPGPIQTVMQAAADQYNMPVCVLTAVASVEGSGMTQLTDSEAAELTRAWTRPPSEEISADLYERINCDPNFANAAGPMQMTPPAFNPNANASDNYLGEHANSVCNATDAIFAAARFLSIGRLPYYGYDSPPTSSEWNTGRIYCAAGETYYGGCRLDAPTCNNLGTNYCDFVLNHCRSTSGVSPDAQCSLYSRFEYAETYQ